MSIVDAFKKMDRRVQIQNSLTMTGIARTLETFCERLADVRDLEAKRDWRKFKKDMTNVRRRDTTT